MSNFTGTPFPGSSGDVIYTAKDPGMRLVGTEASSEVQAIREVAGDLWILTNCDWDKDNSLWVQADTTKASYGLRLQGGASGVMTHYTQAASSTTWAVATWTTTDWSSGSAIGGTISAANVTTGTFPGTYTFAPANTLTTGTIQIGSSTFAAAHLTVAGPVTCGSYATLSRPNANTLVAGSMIWDSDLKKPVWSDGTNWYLATGIQG